MQTILSKEKIDSGSNYNFPDKMEMGFTPMSVFDLSHLVTTTIPNAGIIVPITWFDYIPKDSLQITLRHIMRVMPQVVPLFSRQRIFFHGFAMNYADMQSDFHTLITKGYSGNVIKKIAPLTSSNIDSELYDSGNGVVTPDSLADYFGLPQGATYADLIEAGISCLPFMMYESIYKHYYMNKNYYIENRNWLPDDDEAFRVDENGVLASNTDNEHPKVYFGKLHYRDYPYDYFTSALPFAQRGDRPTLSISFNGDLFNFSSAFTIGILTRNAQMEPQGFQRYQTTSTNSVVTPTATLSNGLSANGNYVFPNGTTDVPSSETPINELTSKWFNDAVNRVIKTEIGVDNLRELIRQQVELEKMARTDGSYAEFGLTFFGIKPQTSHQCKPMYIGGCYSQISFTEVLQTSESSSGSALGQIAGHGISVDNNGYIGHFQASDYGMIMIVATIMPDVYYSQGLDKKWTKSLQQDFYLPERAKLGLQPIKNQEIMFTGTPETDGDLFGYQNPFDDLRYIPNRISGKIADSTNVSFFPFTQSRKFENLPTLSQSFAIADDVRKDYLFAPEEDAYAIQCSVNIRAVRPLPYKPIPNNFGF